MPLLSLAKLLVVLLFSCNSFSLSNIIILIVYGLLLNHRLDSVIVTVHLMRLLLVKRPGMCLSPWNSSLILPHVMLVCMSRVSFMVSHSLVVHFIGLSIHRRMASSMVLWVSISIGSLVHLMPLMSRIVSSHLTRMRSYSTHTAKSLTLSRLYLKCSSFHLFSLLSFHSSFLLSFLVFFSLILSLVKHITNFSKMINL